MFWLMSLLSSELRFSHFLWPNPSVLLLIPPYEMHLALLNAWPCTVTYVHDLCCIPANKICIKAYNINWILRLLLHWKTCYKYSV